MVEDWRTTALAAAAGLTVAGAAWKYLLWPFMAAVWAAIKAAPQIAEDVADLPELIAALRELIAANVPKDIADLKITVARLEERINLHHPPVSGAEDENTPVPMTEHEALRNVRERLNGEQQ